MRQITQEIRSGNPIARIRSVLQHRIEDLRRLAENPVLVACRGEGEGLLRRGQNLLQRADRVREIRSPGDAVGAKGFDYFAEERLRAALAPALRADIDRRNLEID